MKCVLHQQCSFGTLTFNKNIKNGHIQVIFVEPKIKFNVIKEKDHYILYKEKHSATVDLPLWQELEIKRIAIETLKWSEYFI